MAALKSGRFGTQKDIADHLQWAPSKVTTLKARAVEQGAITKAAWDDYLAASREAHGMALVGAVEGHSDY